MKTLRHSLRQKRRSISLRDRRHLSRLLLSKCKVLGIFKSGRKIAIYLTNDGEIDPIYIQKYMQMIGLCVYLPILDGKKLKFAKIGNKFKKNRFGINEPALSDYVNANKLNIILMPLVGFDKNKNRIGMGGGFYDRTLSFKKKQKSFSSPRLYGLAFDCQEVDKLDTRPWDVQLDGVITPSRVIM
ncbi:MAG: 5-formyltetrahydrofolate cyclo-ligase [PS1 clade bacterium]|jgi:5-formyltetrahydrofolate cyclo-ligase|tara:strand:+ start:821 stop:1375 length:555 start_codon:yes stop_codon:yes gene_type:complete